MGRRRGVDKGWELGGGVEVSSESWCTASRQRCSEELSSKEATQNERQRFRQHSERSVVDQSSMDVSQPKSCFRPFCKALAFSYPRSRFVVVVGV